MNSEVMPQKFLVIPAEKTTPCPKLQHLLLVLVMRDLKCCVNAVSGSWYELYAESQDVMAS
jgi:hypothetical protein